MMAGLRILALLIVFGTSLSSTSRNEELMGEILAPELHIYITENTPVKYIIGRLPNSAIREGDSLEIKSLSRIVSLMQEPGQYGLFMEWFIVLEQGLDCDYGPDKIALEFEVGNAARAIQGIRGLVILHIIDVNDETPWLHLIPTIILSENQPVRSAIHTLNAEDPDTGDILTYNLETIDDDDDYKTHFAIDPVTNELILIGHLNYSMKQSYQFKVVVHDRVQHTDSTDVRIEVVPHSPATGIPTFNSSTRVFYVPEDTLPKRKIGTIQLTGGDGLEIKSLSRLVSVAEKDRGPGFLVTDVILETFLDYDYVPHILSLAFEGRNSQVDGIRYHVTMNVTDVNDVRPSLPFIPTISLNDRQPVPSVIYLVQAVDPDTDDVLTYNLETSTDDAYKTKFAINQTTGELSLIGQLDFATNSLYHFNVVVEDKAQHRESADVYVWVYHDTPIWKQTN